LTTKPKLKRYGKNQTNYNIDGIKKFFFSNWVILELIFELARFFKHASTRFGRRFRRREHIENSISLAKWYHIRSGRVYRKHSNLGFGERGKPCFNQKQLYLNLKSVLFLLGRYD
jgi:hypothetical protein